MKISFIKKLLRLSEIKEKGDAKKLIIRYIFSALGVIVIGVGCGIVVEMAVGCDTYTCFNRGIWLILTEKFGEFPFGHINLSVNIILFTLMLIFRRDQIGFGTLFNMVCVGYIIDFVHYAFVLSGVSGIELAYFIRVAAIVVALPVIALGGAMYMEADLGISPADSIPLMLEKAVKGKLGFGVLRTFTDCFFLTFGFLFGLVTGKQFEIAGVGTFILAFFTGTLIVLWRKVIKLQK